MGFKNINKLKKGLNMCEYNNVNGLHKQLGTVESSEQISKLYDIIMRKSDEYNYIPSVKTYN